MSCCCSEVTDLGCVDHCSAIDTGYDATQTGTHTFEFYVGMGTWQTKDVTISTGGDIVIPSGLINENKSHDFKLKNPDGTYYSFGDNDCARITTQIYGEIVT